MDPKTVDAVNDLQPDPHRYTIKRVGVLEYPSRERIPSWTEKLNKGFTASSRKGAQYLAVTGVSIVDTSWYKDPISLRYLETSNGPDFEGIAKEIVKKADSKEWYEDYKYLHPVTWNDWLVRLNSGLGSSVGLSNCDTCHEGNQVLDLNKRYVVIDEQSKAWHSAIYHNTNVQDTVLYWLVKDFLSKYGTYSDDIKVSPPSEKLN